MYSRKTRSVESLLSATDSLSSLEPVIVDSNPAAHKMDSNTTSKPDNENEEVPAPLELHVDSEFFSQLVYFKVNTTLYNVSDTLLPGCGYLASVTNHEDQFDGASISHPIPLNITISEMNSIMRVLHARQTSAPLVLTIQQWSEALHIATIWDITSAREYIIDRISMLFFDQPPIDRIVLADRCGVKQWFYPAYEELCVRRHPPTTEEGIEMLGVDRIVAIFTIREALRAPASSPINDTIRPGRPRKMSDTERVTAPTPNTPAPVISIDNASRMIRDNRVLSLTVAEEEGYDKIPVTPRRDCCVKTSEEPMLRSCLSSVNSTPIFAGSVGNTKENNAETFSYAREVAEINGRCHPWDKSTPSGAPSQCESAASRLNSPAPVWINSRALSPDPVVCAKAPSPAPPECVGMPSPVPPPVVEDARGHGPIGKMGKKKAKIARPCTSADLDTWADYITREEGAQMGLCVAEREPAKAFST
ncbi:hypothetical protein FRB94_004796 [Tulasnella sp. JGI-2019a]|nr:hypothetical protein FRB94_004796 [Tulasnella sp. JGI-2019a]